MYSRISRQPSSNGRAINLSSMAPIKTWLLYSAKQSHLQHNKLIQTKFYSANINIENYNTGFSNPFTDTVQYITLVTSVMLPFNMMGFDCKVYFIITMIPVVFYNYFHPLMHTDPKEMTVMQRICAWNPLYQHLSVEHTIHHESYDRVSFNFSPSIYDFLYTNLLPDKKKLHLETYNAYFGKFKDIKEEKETIEVVRKGETKKGNVE